jgi:hypothetical protein
LFRQYGVVSSNVALAAVLRRVAELVNRDDADMGWTVYEAGDLRSKVRYFLKKADADLPLNETESNELRSLFAPTGPLQETSMASGWADEFLALSVRFDDVSQTGQSG